MNSKYVKAIADAILSANGNDYSLEESLADPELKPTADWALELSEAALTAAMAEDEMFDPRDLRLSENQVRRKCVTCDHLY